MTYTEFLKGTNTQEGNKSWREYKFIEDLYMQSETMTKEDAYRVWEKVFGGKKSVYKERTLDGAKTLIGILHNIQSKNNEFKNIAMSYDDVTNEYTITEG